MDYMFSTGFLGTKAPFFMDMVTLIVAVLPFLLYGSIALAKKSYFTMHAITQVAIYIVSVIVVGYFEYGVRSEGGFEYFMQDSSANYTFSLGILLLHIAIAIVTFLYWTLTIFRGSNWYQAKQLPGNMSAIHKKMALKSFIGIILTSLSGLVVYILLFIY